MQLVCKAPAAEQIRLELMDVWLTEFEHKTTREIANNIAATLLSIGISGTTDATIADYVIQLFSKKPAFYALSRVTLVNDFELYLKTV